MKTEKQFDEFTRLAIQLDDFKLTRANLLPVTFEQEELVVIKFEQLSSCIQQPFNGISLKVTDDVEFTKTNWNREKIYTETSVKHTDWINNLFFANNKELKGFMLCPQFKMVVNVNISALPNLVNQPWGTSNLNRVTNSTPPILNALSQHMH